MNSSFIEVLASDGPAADRAANMELYGWLVGDWEMDAFLFRDGGRQPAGRGRIHFDWVLEGRAIQDVWILPGVFHGTTLRVYDPGLDAWHILWSDPLKQVYRRQLGRSDGQNIVQLGKAEDGRSVRWSFSEITPDSFRWLGETSPDGDSGWRIETEFLARRLHPL